MDLGDNLGTYPIARMEGESLFTPDADIFVSC